MKVLYNGVDITNWVAAEEERQEVVLALVPRGRYASEVRFTAGFTRATVVCNQELSLEEMAAFRRLFSVDLQNLDPRLTPDPVE